MANEITFKTAKGASITLKGKSIYRDGERVGCIANEANIFPVKGKNCIRVYVTGINYISISDADFDAVTEYLRPMKEARAARIAYENRKVTIFVSLLPDGCYEWRGIPDQDDTKIVAEMIDGLKKCGGIKEELINEICVNALKKYRNNLAVAAKQKETEKARIKGIFESAAKTGEKQVVERYTDDCDGSVHDCSFDNIVVYAMPDGTTKTVRTHCY